MLQRARIAPPSAPRAPPSRALVRPLPARCWRLGAGATCATQPPAPHAPLISPRPVRHPISRALCATHPFAPRAPPPPPRPVRHPLPRAPCAAPPARPVRRARPSVAFLALVASAGSPQCMTASASLPPGRHFCVALRLPASGLSVPLHRAHCAGASVGRYLCLQVSAPALHSGCGFSCSALGYPFFPNPEDWPPH